MRFQEFEKVMSRHRMNRYLMACAGQSRKAMTLYRLNLRLSQEMFTIISCFEVALRNAIDTHYLQNLGTDWLRTAARPGGIFDHQPEVFVNNYCNKVPMKRMGNPEDVVPAIHFLLADETSYLTGQNIIIDGGWSIN